MESRGISQVVSDERMKVFVSIMDKVSDVHRMKYDNNGLRNIFGHTVVRLDKMEIPLDWVVYDYNTQGGYDRGVESFGGTIGRVVEENGQVSNIHIQVMSVFGKIDKAKLSEVIQHELSHAWEKINYGKTYQGMELYNAAVEELMGNGNVYLSAVGNIFYMYKRFEDRAYGNGAYAYLMSHPQRDNIIDRIKETELYGAYTTICQQLELLKRKHCYNENATFAFDYINKRFGISRDKIISLGERTVKYLEHIIKRTMRQVENDILKDQIKHTVSPYRFFNKAKQFFTGGKV